MGCILGAFPALAEEAPVLVSSNAAWKTYRFTENGKNVCFMSSQPGKQAGKFKKRGEVFFFVTHWSNDKDQNVVSVSGGYIFKPGSQITVKVNDKTFKLFTREEMAWATDQAMDDAITAELQKGSSLLVKGVSQRGTETTDTYSLKGIGAAYQSMINACAKE